MSRFIERLDRSIVLVSRYHSTNGQSVMIFDEVEILIEYTYQLNNFDLTQILSRFTKSFLSNFLRISKFLSMSRSDTTRKRFIFTMSNYLEKWNEGLNRAVSHGNEKKNIGHRCVLRLGVVTLTTSAFRDKILTFDIHTPRTRMHARTHSRTHTHTFVEGLYEGPLPNIRSNVSKCKQMCE